MILVWDENAWEDYLWWQVQDRKVLRRINALIKDIQRNGNDGIGKPEPLKHGFQGYWYRRITDEHRLVYKVTDGEIRIAACRYHYAPWATATGPAETRSQSSPYATTIETWRFTAVRLSWKIPP